MKNRILIISPKDFESYKGGDAALTGVLVNELMHSFDLYTLSFSNIASDSTNNFKVVKPGVNYVKLICNLLIGVHPIFSRFFNTEITGYIEKIKPDIVICEHLYMIPMAVSARNRNEFKLIANIHVLESRIQKGVWKLLKPLLKRNELSAIKASDQSWSFDDEEVLELKKIEGIETKIRKVNPSFINKQKTDLQGDLFFIGNQFWKPNQIAVQAILNIWPRIIDIHPTAKIRIIGDYNKKWYRNVPHGVSLEGRIDNLNELMKHGKLLIAPITVGGGVRVKILECVSRGIPILTTDFGLGDLKGYFPEILSSSNIAEFENKLNEILSDFYDLSSISNSLYRSNQKFHSLFSFTSLLTDLNKS